MACANVGVHHRVHFVADTNRLFGNNLMRAHSLHRVVAAFHLGDDRVVIVGVEPSAIADLPAGLRVERRVVENDLAFFARLEFLRALPVVNDGQHFAAVGARLAIAFELGFRQLLISGIRRLLGRAFPGGAGALALLFHGVRRNLPDRRRCPDRAPHPA